MVILDRINCSFSNVVFRRVGGAGVGNRIGCGFSGSDDCSDGCSDYGCGGCGFYSSWCDGGVSDDNELF